MGSSLEIAQDPEKLLLQETLPHYDPTQTAKVHADQVSGLGMDFNVFEWSREGETAGLNAAQLGIFLGMFVRIGLVKSSECLQSLFEFAVAVSLNYHDNPYHSFYHAIDVTYVVYYLLEDMGAAEQLDLNKSDKAVLLLSALGHDVLHPGTNNLFQINAKTPVAIKYDNISVLEKQSADFVKGLLEASTLLGLLDIEAAGNAEAQAKTIDRIYDHILKTDMTYHFGMLEQLIELSEYNTSCVAGSGLSSGVSYTTSTASLSGFSTISLSGYSTSPGSHHAPIAQLTPGIQHVSPMAVSPVTPKSVVEQLKSQFTSSLFGTEGSSSSLYSLTPISKIVIKPGHTKEHLMLVILHAADISNPVRPFINCKKWSDLVLQEFLAQGELEKQAGLPISPNMDPASVNQAQTQLSFTQLIVQPLFECILELFPRTLSMMDLIVDNIRQWGGFEMPVAVKSRRATDDRVKVKKSSLAAPPKRASEGSSRRLSLAAGTIDIPDSLQNYFKSKGKGRTSLRIVPVRQSSDDHKAEVDIEEEEETES
ncbi:Calcium/calmodulin-dependent 3',5'-cyclic nucleotide phosphodiesterase 1B [Kappamyces sp. JEL0680]|nr:Calcium/calmodulin-dependent 3',5'-cyclic nucleotide phosphodiesterase 1B [Kappamyces sp. JEL0680]